MTKDELATCDAITLARLVKSREVSAAEVVESVAAAMERLEPELNAFCTPTLEQARSAAQQLDTRISRGEPVGALAGVPVGIKDLILTRGIRTTFGSRLYADYVPTADDIAVERLLAADAIIVGKTNAAEFGYGGFGHNTLFPTTRNPWNTELTPGGSSAGSGAAVAAGLCPMALGSDGGGSVRLPAAFCGLVGVKPTMGRIPLWPGCRDASLPGVSGWESIEHYGPITRTVGDAALMLAVMCGPDRRDRWSLPDEGVAWADAPRSRLRSGLRLAWCPTWGNEPVDPEVRAIAEAAARKFAAGIGATIDETTSPFGDLIEADRAIVAMETDLTGLRRLADGREAELTPSLQLVLARTWRAEDFTDAITERKVAVAAMVDFMDRYDLLLTPTAPVTAFPIERDGPGSIAGAPVADDAWSPCLYPANLTGQPAASVPAGWTAAGLPVGLQIVGRRLADEMVLAAAGAFETIAPWSDRHPPISVWNR
jgi:aspartyl-tRNA(Asn)/glutamyl-tRNA(Gln) amidotransferase subunit A